MVLKSFVTQNKVDTSALFTLPVPLSGAKLSSEKACLLLTLEGLDHCLLSAGLCCTWLFPLQRSHSVSEDRFRFGAGLFSSQSTEQHGLDLQLLLLLFELLLKYKCQSSPQLLHMFPGNADTFLVHERGDT